MWLKEESKEWKTKNVHATLRLPTLWLSKIQEEEFISKDYNKRAMLVNSHPQWCSILNLVLSSSRNCLQQPIQVSTWCLTKLLKEQPMSHSISLLTIKTSILKMKKQRRSVRKPSLRSPSSNVTATPTLLVRSRPHLVSTVQQSFRSW